MKIYEYKNTLYHLDGEVEEIVKELEMQEVKNCETLPLSSICETGIIKDKKCLSNAEIEEEISEWGKILEKYREYDDKTLMDKMEKILFIAEGSYRGDKTKNVAFRIYEDPIGKLHEFGDWYEAWEIYFENDSVEKLYNILNDLYKKII